MGHSINRTSTSPAYFFVGRVCTTEEVVSLNRREQRKQRQGTGLATVAVQSGDKRPDDRWLTARRLRWVQTATGLQRQFKESAFQFLRRCRNRCDTVPNENMSLFENSVELSSE